jgi:hypothetical protein
MATLPYALGDKINLKVLKETHFYREPLSTEGKVSITPGDYLGEITQGDSSLQVKLHLHRGFAYKNLADIVQQTRPEMRNYEITKR